MRNIVFIENADLPFSEGIRMAEKIRRENGTDFLTVIEEGDFRANGSPAEYSARERAARWENAGADLILQLPVFSILGGYGKKDFAVAALMQRLHSVDRVILPCRLLPGQTVQECGAVLRRCAMLMFREHPDYRERLQENLRRRIPFLKAQMDAVICCIPEAGELLHFPENRQSVCMLDAMLQLYYIVQVDFMVTEKETPYTCACLVNTVEAGDTPHSAHTAEAGDAPHSGGRLTNTAETDDAPHTCACSNIAEVEISAACCAAGRKRQEGDDDASRAVQNRLQRMERQAAQNLKAILEDHSRDFLMNISGSTEKAVSRILGLSGEIRAKKYFREIVELVEDVFPNTDMARLFLLRVLLNIRHSDMLISGLYTYVPYCLIQKERADKLEEIRRIEETSWIPFVRADDPEQGQRDKSEENPEVEAGQTDETLRILLDIEQRAALLFEQPLLPTF